MVRTRMSLLIGIPDSHGARVQGQIQTVADPRQVLMQALPLRTITELPFPRILLFLPQLQPEITFRWQRLTVS